MKITSANNYLFKAIKERNLLFTFALGLLLVNILLGIKIFSQSERIVIVPAYQRSSFWVDQKKVSSEYLEEMAIFFVGNMLDIQADSFAFQRKVLLRHVAPEFYGALKRRLIEEEERYKKEALSTSFRPIKISTEPSRLRVELTGLLNSYISSRHIKQTKDSYQLVFNYKDGRLWVKSFELLKSEDKNA